jgi:hypothetical protein
MSKLALAALAALTLAAGAASTPAHAATGYARCPAGYYCMFSGYNGTGTIAYFRSGTPDLRLQRIDNAGSSEWNRSGRPVHLFVDYNYHGYAACSFPNSRGNLWSHWQDRFSSVRVGTCN